MSEEVLVIGHKNPDTDSIAAALGYAALKNLKEGGGYKAAHCGEINRETSFVLSFFNTDPPPVVEHVFPEVRDALDKKFVRLPSSACLADAAKLFREEGVKAILITDPRDVLMGILTLGDLARWILEAERDQRDIWN